MVRLCPKFAPAHTMLGDLYLQGRQTEMAIDAYTKTLALKDDPDSRKLLEQARKMRADFKIDVFPSDDDVRKLFEGGRMAPVLGLIGRKVEVEERANEPHPF